MRNDKFWDECSHGSIREKVAKFIDSSSFFSKFKNEKYYCLEDSLVSLIEENKDCIFEEVLREKNRDKIRHELKTRGTDKLSFIFSSLPVSRITKLAEECVEAIIKDDTILESMRGIIEDVIQSSGFFCEEDEFSGEEVVIYSAYLKNWFKNHDGEYNQSPASIFEFFNNEMQDEELAEYYANLACRLRNIDGELRSIKCPVCDSENINLSNGGGKDFYFCEDCCNDSTLEDVENYIKDR